MLDTLCHKLVELAAEVPHGFMAVHKAESAKAQLCATTEMGLLAQQAVLYLSTSWR